MSTFDWDLIRGKNTIGCNGAYSLGHSIVKVVLFADLEWWERLGYEGTQNYGGLVVSVEPKLDKSDCPWLLKMRRGGQRQGLQHDALVWAGNTGAAAINLALILGARRVFLLGFDMKLSEKGKANWHELRYQKANPEVYNRFLREFYQVSNTLEEVFPGCEVVNVTDDSRLNLFPKVSAAEHFQEVA